MIESIEREQYEQTVSARDELIRNGILSPREAVGFSRPAALNFFEPVQVDPNRKRLVDDGYLSSKYLKVDDYYAARIVGDAERKWRQDHNYVDSKDELGNVDHKLKIAGKDPVTGLMNNYPKKIGSDVIRNFQSVWGLADFSFAEWTYDKEVKEKEGRNLPILSDNAFSQCMEISCDLFGRVRERLCEGLDGLGNSIFDTAYKYAAENNENCDVATIRGIMLDALGRIGIITTANSSAEDFDKEYYGIGQWLYREPALRGVHLGAFERKIGGLRGMALGLGLYYFRQRLAVRTGDRSFLDSHAEEIGAFKEWCDEKTRHYTDAPFVDLDIFNFSVRGIRVVDGKLEDESLKPYVRDVLVPDLLSFDMYEEGSLESIRKIQFGCALAVTVGMTESWFVRLTNNDMAAYYDEIVRLSYIIGLKAGTIKL